MGKKWSIGHSLGDEGMENNQCCRVCGIWSKGVEWNRHILGINDR
jgi:hypothetical protein